MTTPPRLHTPRDPSRPTRGRQVADLARARGRALMPWQARAADVALEIDPATGLYRYGIVVMTVPRQAGKTLLESVVADHRCLTIRRGRVWLTMQTGKDAAAWMRDEHFPALADFTPPARPGRAGGRWREDRRAGSEGAVWTNGSTFRIFAPTRDALHSKQSDLVFVDEAWAHNRETGAALRQAIRPTMNTRPGSQLWIVSTRGDDASDYLNDYLDMAEESLGDPHSRVCLIDYGIPEGADPTDLDVIAAHHPAYGYTIDRPALADAYADFISDPEQGIDGWARAYGNRATRTRRAAIPGHIWTPHGTDPLDLTPDRPGLAIDVGTDPTAGPRVSIGAAWRDAEARAHLRLLTQAPPTRATVDLLALLARTHATPLGYDPTCPGILDLTDALTTHHPDIDLAPQASAHYAGACVSLDRQAHAGSIRHAAQPELDQAVAVAVTRRMLDGGYGWHRVGSPGDISPLVAVTIALRVHDTLPPAPTKPRLPDLSRRG